MLRDFQNLFEEMNYSQFRKIVTIFFLTLFAWIIELSALISILFVMTNKVDIPRSYYMVLNNAFSSLPFLRDFENVAGIYAIPYLELIIAALLIAIMCIPKALAGNKTK